MALEFRHKRTKALPLVADADPNVTPPAAADVFVLDDEATANLDTSWRRRRSSEHIESPHVHVDQVKATDGGGVAYRQDVQSARADFEKRMLEEQRRTRRTLRAMSFECRRRGDVYGCRVQLPEEEP